MWRRRSIDLAVGRVSAMPEAYGVAAGGAPDRADGGARYHAPITIRGMVDPVASAATHRKGGNEVWTFVGMMALIFILAAACGSGRKGGRGHSE